VSAVFTIVAAGAGHLSDKCLNLRNLKEMERFLRHGAGEMRGMLRIFHNDTRYPMKSILDPSFRYTSSVETDLRKTFARVRRELRSRPPQNATAVIAEKQKVVALRRG